MPIFDLTLHMPLLHGTTLFNRPPGAHGSKTRRLEPSPSASNSPGTHRDQDSANGHKLPEKGNITPVRVPDYLPMKGALKWLTTLPHSTVMT
ncbi:hypothetical protein J6590_087403 [Homalodisca vitripennis]|nr:hypothetical protein J6590_087403 [Homalodisca vitripennis]